MTRAVAGITVVVLVTIALAQTLDNGAKVRVFMSQDGRESRVPVTGPTRTFLAAGETKTITLWLEDRNQNDNAQPLHYYTLHVSWFAEPAPEAGGTVAYVDDGLAGGGSARIDVARPDWVFAGLGTAAPRFNEQPGPPQPPNVGIAVARVAGGSNLVDGLRYLGEFDVVACAEATGLHTLSFLPLVSPSANTHFAASPVELYHIGEYQPLTLVVNRCGDGRTEGRETCDDGNTRSGDGCDAVCQSERPIRVSAQPVVDLPSTTTAGAPPATSGVGGTLFSQGVVIVLIIVAIVLGSRALERALGGRR